MDQPPEGREDCALVRLEVLIKESVRTRSIADKVTK